MKKIMSINFCGRIITIEHNAWQKYLAYIGALHSYFKKEEGHFEIINDIENRMAELMEEIINKGCGYINEPCMDSIITRMGTVAAFEELDNDDWNAPGCSPKPYNTGNNLKTIKPFFFLTENRLSVLKKFNPGKN